MYCILWDADMLSCCMKETHDSHSYLHMKVYNILLLHSLLTCGKGKVVPVLIWLSTMLWRHKGEWMCRSMFHWPEQCLDASHPDRFTPREKSPWYSFSRRLAVPQSQFGQYGGENFLDPTGLTLQLLCHPSCSQLLYLLHCPSCHLTYRTEKKN
jgi:hypothetical protein